MNIENKNWIWKKKEESVGTQKRIPPEIAL